MCEGNGCCPGKNSTVEDIYRLIWTAVESKQPIEAIYDKRLRLFCPHRLGRNRAGELRVLCYQYGGESKSGLEAPGSPANWRCTVLEKFKPGEATGGGVAHSAKPFASRLVCNRRRH